MSLSLSNIKFLFGIHQSQSLGKMKIIIRTPGKSIPIYVDVLKDNVPLILGIETMETFKIQPLLLEDIPESKTVKWKQSLVRKYDHVYMEWKHSLHKVFYTRNQLERLHKHLVHTSGRNLYDLLRHENANDIPNDILEI